MNRNLMVGLACMAAALAGCVTARTTYDRATSNGGSVSRTVTAPAPGNVFGPEPNHYFGSGGP